jgi:hypothetical protein
MTRIGRILWSGYRSCSLDPNSLLCVGADEQSCPPVAADRESCDRIAYAPASNRLCHELQHAALPARPPFPKPLQIHSVDERLLGSSEFVESTLKRAGEAYDRRMRLQSAGMGLSEVIGAACRYLGVEERELSRPTRLAKVA